MCYISLLGRLEVEPKHQIMMEKTRFDAIKLHELVKRIFNVSTTVLVDDALGKVIESIYNFFCIRGDDFESLPKCF